MGEQQKYMRGSIGVFQPSPAHTTQEGTQHKFIPVEQLGRRATFLSELCEEFPADGIQEYYLTSKGLQFFFKSEIEPNARMNAKMHQQSVMKASQLASYQ